MFKCTFCTKSFSCASKLDLHMVSHTKEKPHKCPLCPAAFGVEGSVKQHIKVVHDGIKQTKNKNCHCPMCSYKCYNKTSMKVHLRKHSAELPFSCDVSGCGYRTKYKCALPTHALQAHSDKRPFKCPLDGCSYKAKTRAHIGEHLKVHSDDKPFACTIPGCNYTGKFRGQLQQHTFRVHCNEKPFKCSTCHFRVKTNSELKKHQVVHTSFKRFQCQAPNCDFASHHRASLVKHFDRKHRTKEVICTKPRCNFRCGSIALLKLHFKRHENPALKCPFDLCGFRTKTNRSLLQHISRRHEDLESSATVVESDISDLKTADVRNGFHCSFSDCDFKTKLRHHYDRHLITHNDEEKLHMCSLCFSRFSKSSLLKAHVQRHIREKPYRCSHCKYAATSGAELKLHAERIHYIHVIPRGKEDEVRKCRTCSRNCFSISESVLHSMSHLQPVVVLEQLKLHIL